VRTLAVISATYHHRHDGRLWAYAPYARELGIWADLFPRLLVIAPEVDVPPPADTAPIDRENVELVPLPPTGGETWWAKARQLAALPRLAVRIAAALRRADAVHVRGPGNTAVLGSLMAPLFTRRLVAKYAGQWVGYPEEPVTVRFQRAVLRSPWWRGPVTVYGDWPGQPDKVVPFFTSVLEQDQVDRAAAVAATCRPGSHLRVLFVGRLTAPKNAGAVVAAVAALAAEGVDVELAIVGDGPEAAALAAQADRLGIGDRSTFRGALPFEDVLEAYEQADVLALVSESEGWPKAISEAMAFGVVCVGSDRGLVPWMLGEGRGLVVPPGDVAALTDALRRLAVDPEARCAMADRSVAWGARYSLDGLRDALRDLLEASWSVRLDEGDRRLHVLQVTDSLEAGGAERVALNLANRLPRDRFRLALCTTRREGPLAAAVRPDVTRLSLTRFDDRVRDVAAAVRLARFLAAEQIDVVHAHGTSVFLVTAATVLRPTPVVWHDHLGAAPEVRQGQLPLYRAIARRARLVVTVNRMLARWAVDALRLPADKVVRLPNFVLPVAADPATVVLPGGEGPKVVCVANLRAHKDHLSLIRAMDEVHAAHPSTRLLLAGDEPDPAVAAAVRSEVARLGLDDVVTLLGSRADVAALLARCQLGVLSSSSEGFPLALLEYAHAGLAVVATDVGECGEILDDGRLGRLVPAHDPSALARAIIALLDDPDTAHRLGQDLRASVEERYAPERIIEQVAGIYHRVVPTEPQGHDAEPRPRAGAADPDPATQALASGG